MIKMMLYSDLSKGERLSAILHTFVLLLLLLHFTGEITAQRVLTTTEFFSIGREEVAVSVRNTEAKAPRMPWVEEYQLRTETRDFDFDQQEYTLRLSPSTARKRRALTALYNHQEAVPDFDALELRCDALAERYGSWLALFLMDREMTILTRLRTVLSDRQTVLNRQAGSLDFDWSRLIRLQQDLTDLELRSSRLITGQARINISLGLFNPTFSFAGFITLREIGESFPGSFQLAADPELDYELETVARELELEKAEKKQIFDFAQVKYQGPHTDLPRERFSVGVGLEFPNSGERKVKIRELELEEEALRREQAAALAADRADYEAEMAGWKIDFQHYNFMASAHQKEKEELRRIGVQLKREQGFDPLPLLEIEERSLRNELRLLELSADLYRNYLKIRERAGELCIALNGEVLLR